MGIKSNKSGACCGVSLKSVTKHFVKTTEERGDARGGARGGARFGARCGAQCGACCGAHCGHVLIPKSLVVCGNRAVCGDVRHARWSSNPSVLRFAGN